MNYGFVQGDLGSKQPPPEIKQDNFVCKYYISPGEQYENKKIAITSNNYVMIFTFKVIHIKSYSSGLNVIIIFV